MIRLFIHTIVLIHFTEKLAHKGYKMLKSNVNRVPGIFCGHCFAEMAVKMRHT